MLKRVHPIAGAVAVVMIAVFWSATVLAELFGSTATVVMVKQAIPWGFLILVPALAIAGASGLRLGRNRADARVRSKQRRMPLIAANGIIILVPAALTLSMLAGRGDFGTIFYAVQVIELIAGAINLTLMAFMMRDGLSLSGRLRRRVRAPLDA